jgi:hypothetical protein
MYVRMWIAMQAPILLKKCLRVLLVCPACIFSMCVCVQLCSSCCNDVIRCLGFVLRTVALLGSKLSYLVSLVCFSKVDQVSECWVFP